MSPGTILILRLITDSKVIMQIIAKEVDSECD